MVVEGWELTPKLFWTIGSGLRQVTFKRDIDGPDPSLWRLGGHVGVYEDLLAAGILHTRLQLREFARAVAQIIDVPPTLQRAHPSYVINAPDSIAHGMVVSRGYDGTWELSRREWGTLPPAQHKLLKHFGYANERQRFPTRKAALSELRRVVDATSSSFIQQLRHR